MGAVIEFLTRYHNEWDQYLDRIIPTDQTWGHFWTKIWKTVDEPALKTSKKVPSASKVMATVFWDQNCFILIDLPNMIDPEIERKYTVIGDRYQNTFVKLQMAIRAKRPGMLTKGVVFLHDNAHPHRKDIMICLLDDFKWEIVDHPAYSRDKALSDYDVLLGLKKDLACKPFADEASLKTAVFSFPLKWTAQESSRNRKINFSLQ